MAIDVNGTTIQKNGGSLEAVVGATKLFEFKGIGALNKSSVNASFMVGNSTNTWIALTANAWTEYLGWDTLYRVTPTTGSFLSGGRFYAPLSGPYIFSVNLYCYCPSGGYIHPGVWINGNATRGTPANEHSHRIRGHGITTAYGFDLNFTDIKYMVAGDYASFFYYAATSGSTWGTYNSFCGYFLG